jgi:hypothetical protein
MLGRQAASVGGLFHFCVSVRRAAVDRSARANAWELISLAAVSIKDVQRRSKHDREEDHSGIGASRECGNGHFGERAWRRLHPM